MSLRHRHTRVIGWCAALLCIAVFCSLGRWQWQRMHEKQAMLDAVAAVIEKRMAQPLALAADTARSGGYDWASGRGQFIDTAPWLLDNQQRQGQAGVRVFRAFKADGLAAPLLVEMGWLPLAANRELPNLPAPPAGERVLSGLLLPPPSQGLMKGTAMRSDAGHWVVSLDMAEVARALAVAEVAPRILRLDPALPLGHARDLQVLVNTLPPEKHLGYAVQWFALALAVLLTALVLTFRSFKKTP